jgi:hypothetical protein
MIDLDIIRIPESPMKLVMKNKWDCIGCLWYGDNFYRKETFTEEMNNLYAKFHATTLRERIANESSN